MEDVSTPFTRLLRFTAPSALAALCASVALREDSNGRALVAAAACPAGAALAEVPWLAALSAHNSLKMLQVCQSAGKGQCTSIAQSRAEPLQMVVKLCRNWRRGEHVQRLPLGACQDCSHMA